MQPLISSAGDKYGRWRIVITKKNPYFAAQRGVTEVRCIFQTSFRASRRFRQRTDQPQAEAGATRNPVISKTSGYPLSQA
jgi:hypothetical protein